MYSVNVVQVSGSQPFLFIESFVPKKIHRALKIRNVYLKK
jgi:hypothetical protein